MSEVPTTVERLGYHREARVVIIHADDIGMCQASVSAYRDLVSGGLISSASVMVPCPWFPAIAEFCRSAPEVDVGLHLTLTSEWNSLRWGPLSRIDATSGLVDAEGYFPRRKQELHATVQTAPARHEMEMQLRRARDAGLALTHVDSHMFSVFHSKLFAAYVELGMANGLCPVVAARENDLLEWYDPTGGELGRSVLAEARRQGLPTVDHIVFPNLARGSEGLRQAKAVFDGLQPGLTHLVIHPAADTPEIRAITTQWPARVAEYEVFMHPELRKYVEASDVYVIGYKELSLLLNQARR